MDEGSTKSDEEYDDLAMQDTPDNGYASREELADNIIGDPNDLQLKKLVHARRTKSGPLSATLISRTQSCPLKAQSEKRAHLGRSRMRSQSINKVVKD